MAAHVFNGKSVTLFNLKKKTDNSRSADRWTPL